MLKCSLLALSIVSALSGCALEGYDGATGATGPAGETGQTGQPGKDLPRELNVEIVGRFNTGIYGKSAAEIVQFHRTSNAVFAINSALNQIEVIPLANLPVAAVGNGVTDNSLSSTVFTFPDSVSLIDDSDTSVTQALGEANSIAIYQDLLAIAVAAPVKTDNGAVLFYRLSATGEGSFIKAIRVGALPDMLTFTPDGSKVLVANEGEPDTDYLVDPDNTGVVDKVYAYGARSFSIWDQNVNQVFDSGDDFERITAAVLGNNFNSAHTENAGDDRLDDKGGEPEAIDVGSIEGRTYAFIAQERSGDLFMMSPTRLASALLAITTTATLPPVLNWMTI